MLFLQPGCWGVLASSLFATIILGGICIVPLLMFSSRCFPHIVEVKCGSDGFIIKMRDGKHVRCVHNTPQGGHLLDYVPHPAIVLKMEDGTGLLLPIIVCTYITYLLLCKMKIHFRIPHSQLCHSQLIAFVSLQWRCQVCCSWQPYAMSPL